MSLLGALALLFGGLAAFYYGFRALASRLWRPVIRLGPEHEIRRGARVARMDDFRKRRMIDDDPGPKAA